MSIGGTISLPPSRVTSAAVASTLGVAMYPNQLGGTPGSFMTPPIGERSMVHIVYDGAFGPVSKGIVPQPNSFV
jgi:hypothetical protein